MLSPNQMVLIQCTFYIFSWKQILKAVLWWVIKVPRKTGEGNTLLLVGMMEADEGFYMTKEIWNEFKEIFIDYRKLQYGADKSKQKAREESWVFWSYFQKHIKGGRGVGQAKMDNDLPFYAAACSFAYFARISFCIWQSLLRSFIARLLIIFIAVQYSLTIFFDCWTVICSKYWTPSGPLKAIWHKKTPRKIC